MSYIYFIQVEGDGPIKIGTTGDHPQKRLSKIQTDCPWQVKLLGTIFGSVAQEKRMHLVLAPWKMQGEWFKPHPIVVAAIESALGRGIRPDLTECADEE